MKNTGKNESPKGKHSNYAVHETDAKWKDYSAYYPKVLLERGRAKVLIGPDGVIEHPEVSLAVMEIDPECVYPSHSHDSPEIYYVIEGEAECTWDGECFTVRAGSAINTPRGMPHRLKNIGTEKFRAIAFWWAPGGEREILDCELHLHEQPIETDSV